MENTYVANFVIDVNTDGVVQPTFLDAGNFEKFLNGQSYDTIRYVNYPKNATYVPDGPMKGNWSAYIPAQHNGLYLVIKNAKDHSANVSLFERSIPFWG